MRVTVVGVGYVGLVTGLSLAELRHSVTFLDLDKERIQRLKEGNAPIYEPGLEKALNQAILLKQVAFTSRYESAVPHQDVIFLCVGTPSNKEGDADLSQLKGALQAMLPYLVAPCALVIKSTVPVGTHRWVRQYLDERRMASILTVSNPEFLSAGSALSDSRNPHRIVVGTKSSRALRLMQRLYADIAAPILNVTPEEAELIKYSSNAFLATKLSFANTIADMCEGFAGDIRQVTKGMALDPRIGPHFLGAGLGFGGSCFPKDLRSLIRQFEKQSIPTDLLQASLTINQDRIERAATKLAEALGTLEGKHIAFLGLAFKPYSDDIRNSQSLYLLERLLNASANVRAYDPKAMNNAQQHYPSVSYFQSALLATEGVDAVVIATDWPEFKGLPWNKIISAHPGLLIMDCRNLLNGVEIAQLGGIYVGMGVPTLKSE